MPGGVGAEPHCLPPWLHVCTASALSRAGELLKPRQIHNVDPAVSHADQALPRPLRKLSVHRWPGYAELRRQHFLRKAQRAGPGVGKVADHGARQPAFEGSKGGVLDPFNRLAIARADELADGKKCLVIRPYQGMKCSCRNGRNAAFAMSDGGKGAGLRIQKRCLAKPLGGPQNGDQPVIHRLTFNTDADASLKNAEHGGRAGALLEQWLPVLQSSHYRCGFEPLGDVAGESAIGLHRWNPVGQLFKIYSLDHAWRASFAHRIEQEVIHVRRPLRDWFSLEGAISKDPHAAPADGVGFLDILDGLFIILGWNHVTPNLLAGPYLFFDLTFIDWDHSLAAALLWSCVWGAFFLNDKRVAAFAFVACFSHFLADWPMHNADLALYPFSTLHLGMGMWGKLGTMSWIIEGLFVAVLAGYAYLSSMRRGVDLRWPMVVMVLAFINLSPWLSPMKHVATLGQPSATLVHGALVTAGFLIPGALLTWLINKAERKGAAAH